MASTIGRNLHLCFSMIKRPLGPQQPQQQQPSVDLDRPNPTATTLFKNFNSLYDDSATATTTTTIADHHDSATASSSKPSTDSEPEPEVADPDLAAAFASRRFFAAAPGRSNSIVDGGGDPAAGRLGDSVAVPTYSPDPYVDFRRSMQEMVEARGEAAEARGDWEYLHELLLCYLALNPKSAHKFIIGAFSDLLVSLMPPLPEPADAPTPAGKD